MEDHLSYRTTFPVLKKLKVVPRNQGRSQKLFGCTHELVSSFIGVYLNDLCAYDTCSEYEASAAS